MTSTSGANFFRLLSDLWNGRLALGRVFWEYAIVYGSLANLITTAVALAAFARELPAALSLTIFLLLAPYNLLMVVSVWRSAAHYTGAVIWSVLARALILVWAAIVTLA